MRKYTVALIAGLALAASSSCGLTPVAAQELPPGHPAISAECRPFRAMYDKAAENGVMQIEVKGEYLDRLMANYNATPPVGNVKVDQLFVAKRDDGVSLAFVLKGCLIGTEDITFEILEKLLTDIPKGSV